MNQIVQLNAANAEGSADASNTMSSQAEQLEVVIDSLARMMGGAFRKNGQGRPLVGDSRRLQSPIEISLHAGRT